MIFLQITSVQCELQGSSKPADEAGQVVHCNINDGFKCLDSENGDFAGACKNYKLRFYCECQTGMIIGTWVDMSSDMFLIYC